MEIKVLGSGCAKCKTLEKNVTKAVSELGLDIQIHKVEDIVQIMSYGIMMTPGLIFDGKVILSGRVPTVDELKELILKHNHA